MPIEHSKPGAEPTLQQVLTKNVLHEAALQIAAIDANSKSITECAALADRINSAWIGIHASPVVTVFTNSIHARVLICYEQLSTARDAICRAGLHIHSEDRFLDELTGFPDETKIQFEMVGYDCPVLITHIVEESVVAYAKAA